MLILNQLISEATALPDTAKAILLDNILESMTEQIDRDVLNEGVQKAQYRIAEIERGTVARGTVPRVGTVGGGDSGEFAGVGL
ncbi:addiction module protein [Microcoleus sp. ARI1-B5]|uniref:addiction module protein n=1 Tax=unclassified Microcoleus TaxID=2642155 RepID=UPI002FD20336